MEYVKGKIKGPNFWVWDEARFAHVVYMCVFVLAFAGMMTPYRVVYSELFHGEGIWHVCVYGEGVIFYLSVLF